ncbi:MAG: exodeoxyribonuclease VII small subunit [Gemmataceae bacterium]|nr:exodeoxyribonuclease VII small subunit [Gemmataceae bacterium]
MNLPFDEALSFEQALAELDRLVRELEDGKTSLDDALQRYERGVTLLKRCRTQLRDAEVRIGELIGEDAFGEAVTRPFDHAPTVKLPSFAEGKPRG